MNSSPSSGHVTSVVPPPTTTSIPASSWTFPFAAAPDIIRSQQKDAYFQAVVLQHLSNIIRHVKGARFTHTYTTEARTASDLVYFGLTTLLGNRTLGEEYCDIVQVEDNTRALPAISRRAGYILSSVLLPYSLGRVLPSLRSRIRAKLEANLRRLSRNKKQDTRSYKIQTYVLSHLNTITSPSPIHALTLTIFYFNGAYYELSKRIWGLRYIFTRRIEPSDARIGYEVLGVLLVLQLGVQGYLHARSTFAEANESPPVLANAEGVAGGSAMLAHGVEVSLDPVSYAANNDLLFESADTHVSHSSVQRIAETTQTPILPYNSYRYHLTEADTMKWIPSTQQRKCTLCLEEMKDPSATQCGHVFCWMCISDWIKEKPECPLCRRALLGQHVLPLRG